MFDGRVLLRVQALEELVRTGQVGPVAWYPLMPTPPRRTG